MTPFASAKNGPTAIKKVEKRDLQSNIKGLSMKASGLTVRKTDMVF